LLLGKAEAVDTAFMTEKIDHQAFDLDGSSLTIRVPSMC